MIRVTIELVPRGDESKKTHLGTAEIVNDGTGTMETGNYTIRLSKWGKPTQTWRQGELKGFPCQRLGPWDLLAMALIATIGNRLVQKESGNDNT